MGFLGVSPINQQRNSEIRRSVEVGTLWKRLNPFNSVGEIFLQHLACRDLNVRNRKPVGICDEIIDRRGWIDV